MNHLSLPKIQADNLSYETIVHDRSQLDPSVKTSTILVESGTVFDVEISVTRGSTTCPGAMDDDGFKKLVSQMRPGMRIIFGTHKKTDPVSTLAPRIPNPEPKVTDPESPISIDHKP